MTHQEIVPIPSEAERLISEGAKLSDLTLILNAHGTPEHARQTADYIPPNSLVFIEGFNTEETGEPFAENAFMHLNHLRFRYGITDEKYQHFKSYLQAEIKKRTYQEPKNAFDFMPHCFELLQKLTDKDCVINYADYQVIKYVDSADEINRQFRERVSHIVSSALPDADQNFGIAKNIKQIRTSVQSAAIAHYHRELIATGKLLIGVAYFNENYDTESLLKNERGQFCTYLIYGTAHKKSLLAQFESKNVRPKVVEINPLNDHMYLDAISGRNYSNLPRRVGHVALSSLIFSFSNEEDVADLTQSTYEYLDFLNSASQEDQLKFLVVCMQAFREINRDSTKAYSEYLSIMRSITPYPE